MHDIKNICFDRSDSKEDYLIFNIFSIQNENQHKQSNNIVIYRNNEIRFAK